MKKIIAKFCIWVLGKLGYNNDYVEPHEIKINFKVDNKQALEEIDIIQNKAEELIKTLKSLSSGV